ncbi:MAG: type II toxin-antitoxin system VapC family toxin [Armatimonadetes bacterium]|nr:type II toxin-antitoxin system VapC family toxin [Armatimonadota bacterium]NDK13146.1 type II toxin-antitoxin system VapC family toxin [Armatimonadota bacterium]
MNGNSWVLDTNIVQYFLRGEPTVVAFWRERLGGQRPTVSQITRMELLSAPGLTEDAERQVRTFLSRLDVAEISARVEEATVRLRRSVRLRLPDAIIVATAEVLGCPLVTADKELVRKVASRLQVIDPHGSAAPEPPPAEAGDDGGANRSESS